MVYTLGKDTSGDANHMIQVYTVEDGLVQERPVSPTDPLPAESLWVDMVDPSEAERARVELTYDIALPSREQMSEIEPSSRLVRRPTGLFLTAPVMSRVQYDDPTPTDVSFILTDQTLITVRYERPRAFEVFAERLRQDDNSLHTPAGCLLGLLDAVVARLADILETVDDAIDNLSHQIFRYSQTTTTPHQREHERTLIAVGRINDLIAKVNECLSAQRRLVGFLNALADTAWDKQQRNEIKALSRDVDSLLEHSTVTQEKNRFILDTTMGFINMEQSNINKIFSVVALVFLPPTLIGSIYGMNFEWMPELKFHWGYPLALLGMVASAIAPYLYCRYRGWL